MEYEFPKAKYKIMTWYSDYVIEKDLNQLAKDGWVVHTFSSDKKLENFVALLHKTLEED